MARPHELRPHDPDAPLPYTLKVKGRFWYFRHRKFGTIRLPGEYRSREFMQSYHRILRKHGLIYETAKADKREVYFIGWDGGPVKIGVGCDHKSRLTQMQTGCPYDLKLLAWVKGGLLQEQAYHRRFAAYSIRGEWFERSPMIEAEIDRLSKTGEVQPMTTQAELKTSADQDDKENRVRCARKCWSIGEPACWELGIEDWLCADCKAGAEND